MLSYYNETTLLIAPHQQYHRHLISILSKYVPVFFSETKWHHASLIRPGKPVDFDTRQCVTFTNMNRWQKQRDRSECIHCKHWLFNRLSAVFGKSPGVPEFYMYTSNIVRWMAQRTLIMLDLIVGLMVSMEVSARADGPTRTTLCVRGNDHC